MARIAIAILLGLLLGAAVRIDTATAAFAADAGGAPPRGFFGVVPQAPLRASDLSRMEGVIGSLRLPVYWSEAEPLPGVYDFSRTDAIVGAAAEHGIEVLPCMYGTPAWLAPDPARAPLESSAARRAWSSFLRRLVHRYGPGGSFWHARRQRKPIRRWQVWNEPNFSVFWRRPSARGYARLLRLSAGAIRDADPQAKIVAAGVAPVRGGLRPWEFLRRLYAVPGARDDFDFVALHPYAPSLAALAYEVERVRAVMAEAGDRRTPLMITEFGVASDATSRTSMDRGPRGQARFLERAFRRLIAERRHWRIAAAYWYAWKDGTEDDSYCDFCRYSGLLRVNGTPKPAWHALRRVAAGR